LIKDHLKIDFNIKSSFTNTRFANEGAVGGANAFDPTQPVYSGSKRFGGYWERLDPAHPTGLASLAPKKSFGFIDATKRSWLGQQGYYKCSY
jgi:iron complex outermembrane receptor protein